MLKYGIVTAIRKVQEFVECQVRHEFTTDWYPIIKMNGIEWTPKINSIVAIVIDKVGDGVVLGEFCTQVIANDKISIRNAEIGNITIPDAGGTYPTAKMNINGTEREVVLKA